MVIEKICSQCFENKKIENFHKFKYSVDGFKSICKKCISENGKIYREKNKDEIRQRNNKYVLKNKNKIKLKQKQYALNNKNKIREYQKEYASNNKKNISEYQKEWRLKNKEKVKKNNKEYNQKNKIKINKMHVDKRKNNSDLRIKHSVRTAFIQSFNRQMIRKKERFLSYTGIHIDEYINHFNKFELWKNFCNNENIHVDHIIPIALYDFNNPEEVRKCWNPQNLRLIPAEENLIKKDKLDLNLIEKHNIKHLLPERLKNEL